MKSINILVYGGMTAAKFESTAKKLKDDLKGKDVEAEVTFVSSYEVQDISALAEGKDIVVTAGPVQVSTELPVVAGMALLYPWMGGEDMVEEIAGYAR